jgi:tetratricopeptide (TPR) repeat protein
MRWYLARECDYRALPEAAAQFAAYLRMPGGQPTERSYALRALHRLTGDEAHLHKAASEAPWEPDAWERLAWVRYQQQDWREAYGFARAALKAPGPSTHATDPNVPAKASDLAAVAAWNLGRRPEALQLAEAAVSLCPGDPRLKANVEAMRRQTEAA